MLLAKEEQTMGSPFERQLGHLASCICDVARCLSGGDGKEHDNTRPMKVLTNPTMTVGQDKELCPNLELLAEKFPC